MIKKVKRALYKGFVAVRKQVYKNPEIILNNGERFDPFLTKFYYKDVSHVPRYEFAAKLINADESLTDIACGTGWGTEILAKRSRTATGVDISEVAVDYARRKRKGSNLTFVRSDLLEYNIQSDVVVSFETIEHVPKVEFERIIDKLASLARKRLIGSVPWRELPGSNPHHVIFEIDESNFKNFQGIGRFDFYYQDVNGVIDQNASGREIQNLIFTLEKP